VEVGQAVLALNLIDSQADLAERVVLILLEIGERNLEDTALKSVVGVLDTGGAVDEGLANTFGVLVKIFFFPSSGGRRSDWRLNVLSDGEGGRGLEVVPVLLGADVSWVCVDLGGHGPSMCRVVQRIVVTHGSVRFFKPFLPFDNLLFLPTAMFACIWQL
jgi:hypothetical protein